MADNSMLKHAWRRTIRAERSIRATARQLPHATCFTDPLAEVLTSVQPAQVAAFVPHGTEPPVLTALSFTPLLLPRLFDRAGQPLPPGTWAWWDGHTRLEKPKTWAPEQPPSTRPGTLAEVDLVLMPALAADGAGTRLGQGGGWYDRALLSLPPGAVKVAVVYDWELLPTGTLPRETHDVPLDWVITNRGAFRFPQVT